MGISTIKRPIAQYIPVSLFSLVWKNFVCTVLEGQPNKDNTPPHSSSASPPCSATLSLSLSVNESFATLLCHTTLCDTTTPAKPKHYPRKWTDREHPNRRHGRQSGMGPKGSNLYHRSVKAIRQGIMQDPSRSGWVSRRNRRHW